MSTASSNSSNRRSSIQSPPSIPKPSTLLRTASSSSNVSNTPNNTPINNYSNHNEIKNSNGNRAIQPIIRTTKV